MSRRLVYLVPGFFGFTSLGALNYFHRVADVLGEALANRGLDADIVECTTQPTGSLRRRAQRLQNRVAETGGLEADELHFVGHSTGGLDVRLLATPGVRIGDFDIGERIGERIRSVVCVSTPHYGTPLANYFNTVLGRQLLQMVTLFATSRGGRKGIVWGGRALRLAAKVDDWLGRDDTFLDELVRRIFDSMSQDPNDPMWTFLREVASDQGVIIQLTPEAMHLYNAAVVDRPNVYYGSLLTASPNPPWNFRSRHYLAPARASMAAVFTFLHTVAGRAHRHYPYPVTDLRPWSESGVDFDIDKRTNDGIVPTLSQAYGEILDLVLADHLDIVGQFPKSLDDAFGDWLPSGSQFDEARFVAAWDRVASAICDAAA